MVRATGRKQIFYGTLIIIILAGGLPQIELNDDWIKYFDERYDIRISADFAKDFLFPPAMLMKVDGRQS